MNLTLIPHTHLDQVWQVVAAMLETALSDDVTIDQLRMSLVQQGQHLITIEEGSDLIGALTIAFVDHPNRRVAIGTAFGGRGIATQEVMDQVKIWCKYMGASEFRTYAKDAQARLYERLGMKKQYNVVGVTL